MSSDHTGAKLPALGGALAGLLARYERNGVTTIGRKPGRPLKRTPEYLRSVVADYRELRAWFLHEYEEAPCSDRALYTAYFTCVFTARGQRGSRASEPAFQRKLKTTLNELSAARRRERANPEN